MKNYIMETIKFYDDHANDYFKKTLALQDKVWMEKFSSHLQKGSKVLDMGCAFGRDCKTFVEKGFDTYGIDLSKKMIDKAKMFEKKAKFKVMDILKMKFPEEYFDGVWASAILLHLSKDDVKIALKEIWKVLKKGGIVFIGVKEGSGQGLFGDKRYDNSRKFYSYYSEKEIRDLLNICGFSILELKLIKKDNNYDDAPVIHLIARK